MERMIFQADPDLLERLRRRARERGCSVAQVIREAVERELGAQQRGRPSFIGAIRSGQGDLSARAAEDEYEPAEWRSS
jgi:ribbon-helix-helix CopG family protein